MKRMISSTALLTAFASILICQIRATDQLDKIPNDSRTFEFQQHQLSGNPNAQVVSRENIPNSDLTTKTSCYNSKIIDYIKRIHNCDVAADILGQDSRPVVEFFRLNDEFFLDIEDCYSCLRILHNKTKECEVVDDAVVNDILEIVPERLARYFQDANTPYYSIDSLQKRMEKLLLGHFTNHFDKFQASPDLFITDLSRRLSESAAGVDSETQEPMIGGGAEWRERLRSILIRYIENNLSKIMWDQRSYSGVWNSLMKTANSIYQLSTYKIVTHMDDLDDFYWSLTHRFCLFLDITDGRFPVSFYEEIESDITDGVSFFLDLGEQDEGIKSKKDILLEAVVKSKAKAIAIKEGIVAP